MITNKKKKKCKTNEISGTTLYRSVTIFPFQITLFTTKAKTNK